MSTILCEVDKWGGKRVQARDSKWLRGFLEDTGGVDPGAHGVGFTWSYKRELEDLVKKKLDRAFCDRKWLLSYPKA